MSTRSQIGITASQTSKKPEVLLYKHSDGYPSGNLPLIFKFIVKYFKDRDTNEPFVCVLNDSEYFAGWFMYYLMNDWADYVKEQHKRAVKEKDKHNMKYYPADGMRMNGYGICQINNMHCDIEYYYHIAHDRVEVWDWDKVPELLVTYKFKDILDAAKVKFTFPKGLREHMEKTFDGEYGILSFFKNKYDPFHIFDREHKIVTGYDLVKYFTMDINELPLHINEENKVVKEIVAWRLGTKTTTPQI